MADIGGDLWISGCMRCCKKKEQREKHKERERERERHKGELETRRGR